MSLVQISGNASGTGTLTIAAPNTNTNRTLTLPDNTGTLLSTASTFAGTGPAFSATMSANQSVTTATLTKVQANTEEFDTNSNYDNTTNYRFTPLTAGYYIVNGVIASSSGGTQSSQIIAIYKNGSEVKRSGGDYSSGQGSVGISLIISLNGTTDYVELYGLVTSASSPVFVGGSTRTTFQAFLARSA